MPKYIFFLLFIVLSICLSSVSQVHAETTHPKHILFINQVRGGECCDATSTEHLQFQIDQFEQHNLPATFTVRYDALIDPSFQTILKKLPKDQYELGLFLEITPELASKSGVAYTGSSDDWYQAQHAYTLGYSFEDRKKILDTLFLTFKDQFGFYPQVTTGWIVDTPSLNYIRSKYGAKTHQITREQWGTDSYTLSGGPVHYPYLASKNWAFIPQDPDISQITPRGCEQTSVRDKVEKVPKSLFLPCEELLKIDQHLIVRQTVSDPVMNYGDTSSGFTSQPNDYLSHGHTFDYFTKLMTQTLSQTQNPYSFALLGLENSMPVSMQEEFARQIEWVADQQTKDPSIIVSTVSQFETTFKETLNSPITSLHGTRLETEDAAPQDDTVYWINTSQYRLRVIQKGDRIGITDLRIYSPTIPDPYLTITAKKHAYWITPFLLDGSRFYSENDLSADEELRNIPIAHRLNEYLRNRFLPERQFESQHIKPSASDLSTDPVAFYFPNKNTDTPMLTSNDEFNQVTLAYSDMNGQPVNIIFHPSQIEIVNSESIQIDEDTIISETTDFINQKEEGSRTLISWNQYNQDSAAFTLATDCSDPSHCYLTPLASNSVDWSNFYQLYYPYLFPELTQRTIDKEKSLIYAHNPIAISGRNPIRFVLIPKDEYDYPTKLFEDPKISSEPYIEDFSISAQNSTDGTIFIDAVENRVGKYKITFNYGEKIEESKYVTVAPDCRKNKWYCLRHPRQTGWYLKSIFMTELRKE